MDTEKIASMVECLQQIGEDSCVPKTVKMRLHNAILALQQHGDIKLNANKALQELDEISDEPNMPAYLRPQIWNVVSMLERI